MRPSDAGKLLKEEVEPRWDELRAARVHRKVLQELKAPAPAQPRGWRKTALAFAAAAVAAIVLFVVLRRSDVPGTAPVAPAQNAELTLPDGSVVTPFPRSEALRVVPMVVSDGRIEIEQSAGTATYTVTKRPSRVFIVRAGDVRVEVLGTTFRVEVRDQSVRVEVVEGRVQVTRGDRSAVLHDGDDVTFGERESALPLDSDEPVPAPASSASASGTPPDSSAREPSAPAPPQPSSSSSAVADPEGTPAAKLFRQADEARAGGNVEEALRLLRKLVAEHPQDSRVTVALFTMGRLEQQRGNSLAAAQAFDAAGPMMNGEAMAEAALAYKEAGQAQQASALAAAYLKRFPKGPRRAQMESLAP